VSDSAISKAFGVEATTAGSTSKGLGLPSTSEMEEMPIEELKELIALLTEKQAMAQFLLQRIEATANNSLKLAA
tara:strand:+ start:187 stop:408 length:222 start_codon:yes stop_codon:yes gene_type:complete